MSLACPPSASPGSPRPRPISGQAEQVGQSLATATGGAPGCPSFDTGAALQWPPAEGQGKGFPSPVCNGPCVLGVLQSPCWLSNAHIAH